MKFEKIMEILCGLRLLPFFPSDEHAMLALVRMVGAMAKSEDQVQWLVNRMTSGLYAQWPGPQEMRACFCSKFPPKDGINAYSSVYLDGIPAERTTGRQIAGPAHLQIEAGAAFASGAVSADERLADAVNIAVKTMDLKSEAISGPATKEEIAAAPEWLRRLEGYE